MLTNATNWKDIFGVLLKKVDINHNIDNFLHKVEVIIENIAYKI